MKKFISIFFLLLFVSFLGLPSVVMLSTEGEVLAVTIAYEEEESRKSTVNWFEEEIKEVKTLPFSSDDILAVFSKKLVSSFGNKYFSYKNLVHKIPVPPPEFV